MEKGTQDMTKYKPSISMRFLKNLVLVFFSFFPFLLFDTNYSFYLYSRGARKKVSILYVLIG